MESYGSAKAKGYGLDSDIEFRPFDPMSVGECDLVTQVYGDAATTLRPLDLEDSFLIDDVSIAPPDSFSESIEIRWTSWPDE